MADIANTILSRYKADTSDHKRKLRELSGEEKKRHQAMLRSMEDQNKKIDDQIAKWAKIAAGVAAATGAVALLKNGFEAYAETSRLRAANVNTDIGGLRTATKGLVTDVDLLRFSAEAMNGTFALTQKETQTVLQGALALSKTMGKDLTEVMDRVKQAVNEANVEALKPLGITLEGASGKAETNQKIIAALGEEYRKLGGDVETATSDAERAGASFANSVRSIQESLGQIAVALAPVVALVAEAAQAISSLTRDTSSSSRGMEANRLRGLRDQFRPGTSQYRHYDQALRGFEAKSQRAAAAGPAGSNELVMAPLDVSGGGSGSRGGRARGGSAPIFSVTLDDFVSAIHSGLFESEPVIVRALRTFSREQQNRILPAGRGPEGPELSGMMSRISAVSDAAAQSRADESKFLHNVFGNPQDFQAEIQIYGAGFDALAQSVGAAFNAWITGSEDAGDAFKKVLAVAIQTIATQSLVEALKHGAYAIGAYAFYRYDEAAQHAAAAAQFGATAAVAGSIARAWGGGGGPSIPAPSTAGLGRPAAAGSGSRTSVYILGENFDDRTAREREAAFKRRARNSGLMFEGDAVELR